MVGSNFSGQSDFPCGFISLGINILLPSILLSYQPPGFHHIVFLINVSSLPCHDGCDQLEAFYSIFTTEQQDHVKSVEYLRNNFRPQQSLNNRKVSKSAVKDAWNQDMTDILENPLGTEASKGRLYIRILHLTNRSFFPCLLCSQMVSRTAVSYQRNNEGCAGIPCWLSVNKLTNSAYAANTCRTHCHKVP